MLDAETSRLPSGRPPTGTMSNVTELLQRVNAGDSEAREALFGVLYADLHKLASARLRRNETITLLNTTSLVHESYLRFLNARHLDFADRGKFFGYAASVMRSIIVDEIRQRRAERRGGSAVHVELDTGVGDGLAADDEQVLRVHEALDALSALDGRLGKVVEMRYFAGLTEAEIGELLGVTERTVRRDWDKARILLFEALR
jgi:RNA polymerase sigma factor (TIGR02999 family)